MPLSMNFYHEYCLPHLINFACGFKAVQEQRKKVVPVASGHVLEVGMGSGLNIPFYDADKVELVWGLEPSAGMRKKAQHNFAQAPFEVRWIDLPGEEIPLENNSVDTVLLTYTLCSIADWNTALQQMRRVLKPGGLLVFCEHGEAPDAHIRKWQERINPVWRKLAGGCNLNRPIPSCIEESGFNIHMLNAEYLPAGPKILGYNYWGAAKPA